MSNYDDIPTLRHEPEYLADYGLQRPPFLTEHDDRFIYLDEERRQLLDILQHLTRYSRLMLIVVGERGIGKTSIKQYFINQADERYLISDVAAHPMMDANELLSSIAQGFGLFDIPASPADLQNNLYGYLAGLQQQDRTPVLLVDDAHELPHDALQALFYLADAEAGEGNLLRLVLFCEPAIEVMLESSAIQPLRERVTHHIRLSPFDEAQTAEYIRHRLGVAGLDGASPFTPRDIRAIYQRAEGIPVRINDAAYRLLVGIAIEAQVDDEPQSVPVTTQKRALSRGYLAAAGGGVVLLVVALIGWPDPQTRSPVDLSQSNNQSDPAAMSSPQKVVDLRPEQPGDALAGAAGDQRLPDDQMLPVKPVGEPVAAASPALQIEAIEPNPVPASDELQTVSLHGEGFDASTRITVEWDNQRKTLDSSRVALINDKQLDFRLRVGTRPQTWELLVRNPQSDERVRTRFTVEAGSAAEKDPAPPAAAGSSVPVEETIDIDWLQRQPADHYTLQLLATHQHDNLQAFLQRHELDTQSVIVESRKNREPWYAAVLGSYPDSQAAREAVGDLPADIATPWIRRIGDVQASLAGPADESITDKPVPRSATLREHTAWLWDQDPDAYTLQLIAGSNEPAIQDFIDQHDLRGEAVFYQTRRNGSPWFVVVLGRHADREAALAAREALPASLREQSPWPRAFGDIHGELAAP